MILHLSPATFCKLLARLHLIEWAVSPSHVLRWRVVHMVHKMSMVKISIDALYIIVSKSHYSIFNMPPAGVNADFHSYVVWNFFSMLSNRMIPYDNYSIYLVFSWFINTMQELRQKEEAAARGSLYSLIWIIFLFVLLLLLIIVFFFLII